MLFLYLALFLSGTSSLIYEVVWLRLLVLIFGNTAHSTIIILSVFMAGLASGSFIFGRLADSSKNLLRIYVLIELGIGTWSWLTLRLINLAQPWFQLTPGLELKLFLSFLILFPATTLMGATLPVVVKLFHQFHGQLSIQVSRLYAINTIGAVIGTLLSGFILIELFGLRGTLIIAVLGNLIAAILAGLLRVSLSFSRPHRIQSTPRFSYSPTQITLLLLVFGISGLISLAYEIIFLRLITPSLGTFIYGFSASLAIYLLGLATGSFMYQRWFTRYPTIKLVGYIQLLIGLIVFLALTFTAQFIPLWLPHPLVRLIAPTIVFYPLTILLGLIFPAITQVFDRSLFPAGLVGLTYAINSLGSIFGSLVAGFVLIPLAGSVGAAFILAILNAFLGLVLLLGENSHFRPSRLISFGLTIPILILTLFGLYRTNDLFLPRYIKVQLQHHLRRWPDTQYFLKEDVVASVFAVTSQDRPGRKLLIDGVGTTSLSEETKILAHLPLLLHPNPQDALIIALGMGTTHRSALSHPQVQVDAVELVPSVPAVLAYFHPDASQILANSRGRIIINDGRNYVFTSNKKYDVVAIDPPPPDNAAGTTILFSQNFYQDIKRILKPNGIMLGWFHYDVDVESFKMMLQAFVKEFPHILVFRSPRNLGLYLVGSQNPLWLDQTHINQLTSQPSVKADMAEWSGQVYDYDYLLSLYLGTEADLKHFVGEIPPVTDYYPRSEYFLLRQFFHPSPLVSQEIIDQFFTTAH